MHIAKIVSMSGRGAHWLRKGNRTPRECFPQHANALVAQVGLPQIQAPQIDLSLEVLEPVICDICPRDAKLRKALHVFEVGQPVVCDFASAQSERSQVGQILEMDQSRIGNRQVTEPEIFDVGQHLQMRQPGVRDVGM